MVLEGGDPAPTVSASNQHGESVQIDGAEPTVVYFYPKDDTPGCRTEATQFSAELDTYREAGIDVYGVSVDDIESHRAFAEANDIEIDLLADPEGALADAFDVERGPDGRTRRTTFVLADGMVRDVYTDVDPDGHARELMMDLLDSDIVDIEW